MIRLRSRTVVYLCATLFGLTLVGAANPGRAENEPDRPAAKAVASPESTAELVKQLDADEFARREEASRQLSGLGAAAVPDLAKAAQGRSLEASARAFAILKKFATSEDGTLQGTAREALTRIAAQREPAEKSKDDALAAAAAKAAEILGQSQTPRYADGRNVPPPAVFPQPQIPFGAQPRMIIRGHQVVGNRISVKVVDGTREVDAEETMPDGQKRSVKMVSDPKSGIRMEVTTTKDGKPLTEKYAAKDVESLKKDHPEAAKIYEQYNGAGGVMQFGGGQIHIQGGRVEIGGGGIRAIAEPAPRIDVDAQIENQMRQLIEANPENRANVEALQALQRQLMQQRQRQRQLDAQRKRAQEGQPLVPAPQPAPAPAPRQLEKDLFGE
ncbi:MAG: hypothetical protein K8T91_00190 [Planctomycetes bacterium]|nr:hypothetical protein [Planctomycetota bacterium]